MFLRDSPFASRGCRIPQLRKGFQSAHRRAPRARKGSHCAIALRGAEKVVHLLGPTSSPAGAQLQPVHTHLATSGVLDLVPRSQTWLPRAWNIPACTRPPGCLSSCRGIRQTVLSAYCVLPACLCHQANMPPSVGRSLFSFSPSASSSLNPISTLPSRASYPCAARLSRCLQL